ncbi:MAG: hypothetical protein JW955_13175 [Sedimentisphaerales bacterium]|nr:hypothetical protein [Sedimentisphaerales bacterium]
MRRLGMYNLLIVTAIVSVWLCSPARAGQLLAWGSDRYGQVSDLPAGTDYAAIAAGDAHGLALTSDGEVVAWGQNDDGQCDVPAGTYRAIGTGARFSLAIRTDGSLAVWGDDSVGQVSTAPRGSDFVAVDGGLTFAVALKSDGSIVAWGDDRWGQVSGIPGGDDFAVVAAGDTHAVALRSDGSVASWGYPTAVKGMPTTGTYRAVDAGGNQSVALSGDGTIAWWGEDPYNLGLAHVPTGKDHAGAAAGYLHCLALKMDGSVVGWGAGTTTSSQPDLGQANPPKRDDFVAIAGGLYFSLGLTRDTEEFALSDDFNDGRQGTMWLYEGDDLTNCRLDEVNQRLELRTSTKAEAISAHYLSNGWGIDPTRDFRLRVAFRQNLVLGDTAWLSVVLTPNTKNVGTEHIGFGVGSSEFSPYFTYEAIGETVKQSRLASRSEETGVLYVSYDATLDELYLSSTGYGAEKAWATARGFLQGMWGGQILALMLEGGADRLEVRSGQAYFDDFVVESGNLVLTGFGDVYRFWSPILDEHFYTISEKEKDALILNYPDVWTFEGPVFKAAGTALATGLAPVYRFWSDKYSTHFYTISETEKDEFLTELADVWTFEGVAFFAYPEGLQPTDAKPVYRFWRQADNAHFYTISEAEKDMVLKKYRDIYIFEGVVFYVYGL